VRQADIIEGGKLPNRFTAATSDHAFSLGEVAMAFCAA
jgi:hypothetical protein